MSRGTAELIAQTTLVQVNDIIPVRRLWPRMIYLLSCNFFQLVQMISSPEDYVWEPLLHLICLLRNIFQLNAAEITNVLI